MSADLLKEARREQRREFEREARKEIELRARLSQLVQEVIAQLLGKPMTLSTLENPQDSNGSLNHECGPIKEKIGLGNVKPNDGECSLPWMRRIVFRFNAWILACITPSLDRANLSN